MGLSRAPFTIDQTLYSTASNTATVLIAERSAISTAAYKIILIDLLGFTDSRLLLVGHSRSHHAPWLSVEFVDRYYDAHQSS